jgi:glyoxylase-like metal-dependent hydrolase (beta-lactamase superfamily II)
VRLGNFEIHALSDGAFKLDGGQMFGVVPKPLWERKIEADALNRIRLGLTCLLVEFNGRNLLIETGIGEKFDAKHADIYGVDHSEKNLLADLAKHGIRAEDVHIVINTHLHFDHCGWNTRREDTRLVPTFPRARYFVQRAQWEHALEPSERDRASYVHEFFLAAESQTELLEGEAEILPGVRVELLPGHTRHMQGVRVGFGHEQACFISDLVPTAAHLSYPWIMSFDLYPMETLDKKKRLLPELASEEAIVVFPHDPSAPWARLTLQGDRIVSVPVPAS